MLGTNATRQMQPQSRSWYIHSYCSLTTAPPVDTCIKFTRVLLQHAAKVYRVSRDGVGEHQSKLEAEQMTPF